jgi:16S rRNA (uracil1498-N3)-methyltransferase
MARPDFTSPRLFVDHALEAGATVSLTREQGNYALNVLRLETGAPLLVFNGRDGEWKAAVQAGKRSAAVAVLEQTRAQTAASPITYAFAPLKHARLDYMVQKAVEMGAGALQPLLTRRTQVSRINADRMRANVIEAAEQCGVLAVPEVREERRFEAWLSALPPTVPIVFCDEDAETHDPVRALQQTQTPQGTPTVLLIGPEGGFDPAERAALLSRESVVRLSLGPRILRADTAAVAALALVQAVLGDWRSDAL